MITKTKKIYYCEHCKKHYLRRDACETHEKHCTANLDRECRTCGHHDRDEYERLITHFNSYYDFDYGDGRLPDIKEVIASVDNCPQCTLTVLRGLKDTYLFAFFNYKKMMKEWWDNNPPDYNAY